MDQIINRTYMEITKYLVLFFSLYISCEIEDFVETHLFSELCVALPSPPLSSVHLISPFTSPSAPLASFALDYLLRPKYVPDTGYPNT